jgi:hypothetical protein
VQRDRRVGAVEAHDLAAVQERPHAPVVIPLEEVDRVLGDERVEALEWFGRGPYTLRALTP